LQQNLSDHWRITEVIQRLRKVLVLLLTTSIVAACFDVVDKVPASTPLVSAATVSPTASSSSNNPPEIFGTPSTNASIGRTWSFTPSASDPDGDTIEFNVANLPTWANFDPTLGQLSGTPLLGDEGSYNDIEISVSDGEATVALPVFSVTVHITDPNAEPTIEGRPGRDAVVGQSYSFTPTASDPDGDLLTFSIANKPRWMTFNDRTGELSGVAVISDIGSYSNIVISVSDGARSASLPAFRINVEVSNVTNQPPRISGNPPTTAAIDNFYSFRPRASDQNGDTLVFSVANLPPWANFNTSTGRISGTPVSGQEGTYRNIQIFVGDGSLTASLPAFSISVAQLASGSVTLSWTPPNANTDGSPLTDLARYKIYYGTESGVYPNEVRVNNPGLTSVVIENLAPNTYYFVSTSINRANIESGYSNEAVKTVN